MVLPMGSIHKKCPISYSVWKSSEGTVPKQSGKVRSFTIPGGWGEVGSLRIKKSILPSVVISLYEKMCKKNSGRKDNTGGAGGSKGVW